MSTMMKSVKDKIDEEVLWSFIKNRFTIRVNHINIFFKNYYLSFKDKQVYIKQHYEFQNGK